MANESIISYIVITIIVIFAILKMAIAMAPQASSTKGEYRMKRVKKYYQRPSKNNKGYRVVEPDPLYYKLNGYKKRV